MLDIQRTRRQESLPSPPRPGICSPARLRLFSPLSLSLSLSLSRLFILNSSPANEPPPSPRELAGGCGRVAVSEATQPWPFPCLPFSLRLSLSLRETAPDLILIRLRRCWSVILRERICTDIVFSAFSWPQARLSGLSATHCVAVTCGKRQPEPASQLLVATWKSSVHFLPSVCVCIINSVSLRELSIMYLNTCPSLNDVLRCARAMAAVPLGGKAPCRCRQRPGVRHGCDPAPPTPTQVLGARAGTQTHPRGPAVTVWPGWGRRGDAASRSRCHHPRVLGDSRLPGNTSQRAKTRLERGAGRCGLSERPGGISGAQSPGGAEQSLPPRADACSTQQPSPRAAAGSCCPSPGGSGALFPSRPGDIRAGTGLGASPRTSNADTRTYYQ